MQTAACSWEFGALAVLTDGMLPLCWRAEGDGETMIVRRRSFPFRRRFHVRTRT
jgi:hypothetical protein